MSEQDWDPTKIVFLDRDRTFRADIKLDLRQSGEVGPPGEQSPDGSSNSSVNAPVIWEEVPEEEADAFWKQDPEQEAIDPEAEFGDDEQVETGSEPSK
jgi:hypothetical protein